MRSFFRKPSWADRGNEDSAPDFYRRSEQTYADIIAATKEARERSATDSAGDHPANDGKKFKPRRISNEACVRDGTPPDNVDEVQDQPPGVPSDRNSSSIGSSPGPHDVLQEGKGHGPHEAREMTSAYKTDTVHDYNSPTCDRGSTSDIQSTDWVNQPRSSPVPRIHKETNSGSDDELGLEDVLNDNRKTECQATHHDTNVQGNVVVQILITSEIKNTKPLIVHRKISQSLREVRLAWCKRQGFTEEMQSSVFLTWKGRRLFDVTTCRSLGVNSVNSSVGLSDIRYPPVEEGTTRVHMEAVTDDFFTSKRQQRLLRTSPTAKFQPDREFSVIEHKEQDVLIKIILKCPGLIDYGTKVSQRAHVSHIIAAFKNARRIPAEKHVYLLFDGDRLDPDTCLMDYDIADLDLVDVLIK